MFFKQMKGGNYMTLARLYAGVTGEMSADDIPVSKNVDLDALKNGDDDPMEVVVEVPASKSKRGWNYTVDALEDIVKHVNKHTLNADLGHQRPENVSNEFRPPVTHWVGAKMIGNSAYFRGVVDAAAKDLKRWIRAGRVKQVSIFGRPELQKASGETHVVGYEPLSIDWTPLDRMGMPTRIVAIGEMEEVDPTPKKEEGDDNTMNKQEILDAVKKLIEDGELTVEELLDFLGATEEEETGEMAALVEVFGEMDSYEDILKDAKDALEEKAKREVQTTIGEMAEEKIISDAVRKDFADEKTPLGKLWALHSQSITVDSTKEDIAGEMDAFLNDDAVKTLISSKNNATTAPKAPSRASERSMTKVVFK